MAQVEASYGAKDIQVLEGLDPVRKRPGMYIGSTGPTGLHHLVWEVVDNSVDEAMAGHATRIDVSLTADGGVRVSDDGRGIPTDPHPQYKDKSAAEVVLTVLHAGGKFGGGGYKVSGGLHGVGISVVNALSTRLLLEIDRDGSHHSMEFAKGGKPQGRLEVTGRSPRGRTGTTVTFWPDPLIFEDVEFRAQTVTERLQMMAFLNRGLEIRFTDQRPGHEGDGPVVFKYAGGIEDFVRHLNASKEPLFKRVGYLAASEETQEVEIAFQWNTGLPRGPALLRQRHRHQRGRHARGGVQEGAHQRGQQVREGAWPAQGQGREPPRRGHQGGPHRHHQRRLQDPQFEGQTKAKLGNVSMRSLVERSTNERLGDWLEEHPPEARQIVQKSLQAARARMAARQARDATRRKSPLEGAGMPGKLTDCSVRNPREAEIFIVEGDSAGGSAIKARNPRNQAILPIRGKILNVERARIDKMLKNNEVEALVKAVGRRASARSSTSRRSATTRSSSWPTPTSTAATSDPAARRSCSAR
jgi:DNA gyrase subunit B